MKKIVKRTIMTTLAAAALTAGLTAVTSTSAFAISEVPCGPSEYTKLVLHYTGDTTAFDTCYANGGEMPAGHGTDAWVTQIWTGNNRVQWYGDGRWQPDQPIGQWTTFSWPNNRGGVRIDKVRIV